MEIEEIKELDSHKRLLENGFVLESFRESKEDFFGVRELLYKKKTFYIDEYLEFDLSDESFACFHKVVGQDEEYEVAIYIYEEEMILIYSMCQELFDWK